MVKRVVSAAAVAFAMTSAAFAQAPDAPQVRSAFIRFEGNEEQMRARRQRVATMEAVLERAVSFGADNVISQVRSMIGDQPILVTAPRANGTRLENYGVFFDVAVPTLQVPILWPVRHLVDDARTINAMIAELRLFAAQLEDPRSRAGLQNLIAKLESQGAARAADRLQPRVSAASVVPEDRAAAPAAPPRPPIDDPQEEYRKQVKAAIVDAMLENSQSLGIGAEEWLVVAARRNAIRDPLFPGDTVDTNTWVARVKGSVLADLRAQRITLEDARTLVQTEEQ